MTTSSEPVERLYTPDDFAEDEYMDKLGFPGQWPYTRGVHATGHRGRLWTMRMFAGFGNAEETNERFKYLLANGNAGLSVAYDMPTLYGYDTDDPNAEGEFGTCGVAVSSLADMEVLFDGIPLDQVTTSMTINSPAAMIWAMYLVNAEKRGIAWDKLSGTTQNDILKEYIAQKEYIFPPRPSTKLVVDTFEFGAQRVPRWNTISISGYHIREAGATALQELAFTLADGIQYVQSAVDAGLDVDRVRAAAELLLRHPQRLPRRNCQAARGAARLGAGDEGAVRRAQRAVAVVSLPLSDGGCEPVRRTAREQHRAHDHSGARGSAGRHTITAHQQHGRGDGAAVRKSGADCASNAADHCATKVASPTASIRWAAATRSRR